MGPALAGGYLELRNYFAWHGDFTCGVRDEGKAVVLPTLWKTYC